MMKAFLSGAFFVFYSCVCAANDDSVRNSSYSVVLTADYATVDLGSIAASGVVGATKFNLKLESDPEKAKISVRFDEAQWMVISSDGKLPANIHLNTVAINRRPDVNDFENLLLSFNYGAPVSACDLTINDVPLSYALVTLYQSGKYKIKKYELQENCTISEINFEARQMTNAQR